MTNFRERKTFRQDQQYDQNGHPIDRVRPDQEHIVERDHIVEHHPVTPEQRVHGVDRDVHGSPSHPDLRSSIPGDQMRVPVTDRQVVDDSHAVPQVSADHPFSRRAKFNQANIRERQIEDRVMQERVLAEQQKIRDNDNAARGLMTGIILTGLAGLVIGTLFALGQQDRSREPLNQPIIVPNTAPQSSPQVRERVIEQAVPVPQQGTTTAPQSSGSTTQPTPNVIIIPSSGQSGTQSGGTVQTAPPANTTGSNTSGGATSGNGNPGTTTGSSSAATTGTTGNTTTSGAGQ